MSKSQYFLMLTICFSKTINLIDTDVYPPDSISLAKGFFESSGLKEFMNISKCQKEFNEFIFTVAIILDQMLDNKNVLSTIGSVLIDFSNLKNKCDDSEFGRSVISEYFHKAVNDPQRFLLAVLDKMLSFHVAGKYFELKSNLKDKLMYQTGKTLGDILRFIMNIDIENMPLFLTNTNNDNCSNHYMNFMGSVYNMINSDKSSMPILLQSMTNLINSCK
jgi:hypothetical protein